jgi:hypothetical protein
MFHFHKLTRWSDILIFNYGSESVLLQGRKCTKCSATFFRISRTHDYCGTLTEDNLKQAKLWNPENKDSK